MPVPPRERLAAAPQPLLPPIFSLHSAGHLLGTLVRAMESVAAMVSRGKDALAAAIKTCASRARLPAAASWHARARQSFKRLVTTSSRRSAKLTDSAVPA